MLWRSLVPIHHLDSIERKSGLHCSQMTPIQILGTIGRAAKNVCALPQQSFDKSNTSINAWFPIHCMQIIHWKRFNFNLQALYNISTCLQIELKFEKEKTFFKFETWTLWFVVTRPDFNSFAVFLIPSNLEFWKISRTRSFFAKITSGVVLLKGDSHLLVTLHSQL